MTDTDVRQTILDILQTLEFDRYLAKASPHTKITCDSFDKLDQLEFRLIFYFLFRKLHPEQATKRFRSVYPARDIQQETEFRKICFDWIQEINDGDGRSKNVSLFGKVLPIYFQRLAGVPFVALLEKFASYVLQHVVNRVDGEFMQTPIGQKLLNGTTVEEAITQVNELEKKISSFRTDIREYRIKVEKRYTIIQEKNAQEQRKAAQSNERYGELAIIMKANEKLENDLHVLNRYLRLSLDQVLLRLNQQQQQSSCHNVNVNPNNTLHHQYQRNGFNNTTSNTNLTINKNNNKTSGEIILDRMHQVKLLIRLLKERGIDLIDALRSSNKWCKQIRSAEKLITDCETVVSRLNVEQCRLKQQILQSDKAAAVREDILNKCCAPLMQLSLKFSDYGIDTIGNDDEHHTDDHDVVNGNVGNILL